MMYHALLACCTTLAVAQSGNVPLDLVLLTDAQGKDKGAVCLDGSNPGFYMTKGTDTDTTKWVLYFKGGGWCYDEVDCPGTALALP